MKFFKAMGIREQALKRTEVFITGSQGRVIIKHNSSNRKSILNKITLSFCLRTNLTHYLKEFASKPCEIKILLICTQRNFLQSSQIPEG